MPTRLTPTIEEPVPTLELSPEEIAELSDEVRELAAAGDIRGAGHRQADDGVAG
jgi:hypothetical protein